MKEKTKVAISTEQQSLLSSPVDGYHHNRQNLVLANNQLYCQGCNTWFGTVQKSA